MRHPLILDLLPAALLLLGSSAALALQPRAGAAVFAVLTPGHVAALPADWRLRRVLTAWPFATLVLDADGGLGPAELGALRAATGAALLFSLPAGADCLIAPR